MVNNVAAFVAMPELSDGPHTLIIYLYGYNQKTYQPQFLSYVNTINFAVDSVSPNISMLTPENNATYSAADIPLNFTLNEQTTNITCILDGNQTTIPAENTTLTGLSVGEHSLTLTAHDAAGNVGVSQPIQFIITTPTPTPTLQPAQVTLLPRATVAIVIVAGVFAYSSDRKNKTAAAENS